MHRLGAICLLLAVALGGCQRGGEGELPPVSGATAPSGAGETTGSVAQVEGIEWFAGDIDAAFAHAAAEDKPVFLYWGAEWCPPCYDLKAHVFPRPDFQQSLRQFVAVYLDGDAPGAQRIAGEFRVLGYPSVVVLRADRTELARISGGSDLASYADVLELALHNAQPVDALLASLRDDPQHRLSAADCRRLAWNDWSAREEEGPALAGALQLAATRCPDESPGERDRLTVNAAAAAATAERAAIEGGAAPSAVLAGAMRTVQAIVADPVRRLEAGNALLYLGEEFFVVARHLAPGQVPELRQQYFAMLDALETDERQSATVRLLSAARRVQVAKALGGTDAVPADVAGRARATLTTFLDRDHDANARAGIVNSASWVLYELGDDVMLRALLMEQMKVARTPYYYMPDLADIEERAGNLPAALDWLQRGYEESRGPATRFQWGTLYVNGLLRMAPQDAARIRTAVLGVLGELDAPDRIHARTRTRLERLDAALEQWSRDTGNATVLADITRRWRDICARLPAADPARAGCAQLLGG